MVKEAKKVYSKVNKNAIIRIIPGHFATNHSHINYYVDMTFMKSRRSEAAAAAAVLARKYTHTTYIDTIICMDGCEVIGAYLADELTESGIMSVNEHNTMYIVTPEVSAGQLIFRDNMQPMIRDKHCLLLLASATTGRTIASAVECVQYYGGQMAGIAAIFSASKEVNGIEINSIFGAEDIEDYRTYEFSQCPMCAKGMKLDAIVNSYGYSRL